MNGRPDPKSITTHELHRKAKKEKREENVREKLEGIKTHMFQIRNQVDALNPEPDEKRVIYNRIVQVINNVDFLIRELGL